MVRPGSVVFDERLDVPRPGRGKHLRRRDRHVLQQGAFILAPDATDPEHGNSPGIHFGLVEFDKIFVVGQTLAEPVERHVPRPGTAEGVLEIRAEAAHLHPALPLGTAGASLKTVPSQKQRMLLLHVAEARNVNSIGTVSQRDVIFVPRNAAAGAAAHAMVHHVVAQFPAGIGQPVGKFRGGGVEQNAGRLERRGAQEYNPAAKLDGVTRLPVDDPHAGDFPRLGIEHQAVHDAVRTHRHLAGASAQRARSSSGC